LYECMYCNRKIKNIYKKSGIRPPKLYQLKSLAF
jgi:hypothetical protein